MQSRCIYAPSCPVRNGCAYLDTFCLVLRTMLQLTYLYCLLLLAQMFYAIAIVQSSLQLNTIACVACAVRAKKKGKVVKRQPPAVYVRARSTSWTEIVLRPDLFEDTRFKFFFRITRARFDTIVAALGNRLQGRCSNFKRPVSRERCHGRLIDQSTLL
jgi:hypothetical protein